MKILLLYYLPSKYYRKTIDDHLFCFRRYINEHNYHYFNALEGIPKFLAWIKYDAVILHYTFLAVRWDRKKWPFFWKAIQNLKLIRAPIIAIPQDEYAYTQDLWKVFNRFKVETVFTLVNKKEYKKFYPPEKITIKNLITVFPGYVDELTTKNVKKLNLTLTKRPIDIGYRARKIQYWCGRKAYAKWVMGETVKAYCQKNTNLKVDISSDVNKVFYGDDWIRFLLRCKVVLGLESGVSMIDIDGKIQKCIRNYLKSNINPTFDEVQKMCFSKPEREVNHFMISPRIFEACITKTCQVLVTGAYSGVLKPGIHYIELKPDYSNLAEVIRKVKNDNYIQKVVNRAFNDIVVSGKYSYRRFAEEVLKKIQKDYSPKQSTFYEVVKFDLWKVFIDAYNKYIRIKLFNKKVFSFFRNISRFYD